MARLPGNVFLLAIFLLVTPSAYAIITMGHKFINPQTRETVYLLADTHLDACDGVITEKQRHDIIKSACSLKAIVIAEDLSTFIPEDFRGPSHVVPAIDTYFSATTAARSKKFIQLVPATKTTIMPIVNPYEWQTADERTPLHNMIRECCSRGITTYNAEIRFASAMSLEGHDVTARDVLEVNDAYIRMLQSSRVPSAIQQFYRATIALYNKNSTTCFLREKIKKNVHCSLADCIGEVNKETLNLYDSMLIDAMLIHGWYTTKTADKPSIIVAGGSHIRSIIPLFKQLGFKLVKSTGRYSEYNDDGSQVIISVVDMSEVLPQKNLGRHVQEKVSMLALTTHQKMKVFCKDMLQRVVTYTKSYFA